MQYVAFSSGIQIQPLLQFYGRTGAPIERYLSSAGLPSRLIEEPEGYYPTQLISRLCSISARGEWIRHPGLAAGGQASTATHGPFGCRLRAGMTLADSVTTVQATLPKVCSATAVRLEPHGDRSRLSLTMERSQVMRSPEYEELHFMMLVDWVRMAAGSQWRPLAVGLEAKPTVGLEAFDVLSAARIEFHQEATWVEFPVEFCNRVIPGGRYCRQDLPAEELPREFAPSVQMLLETLLREDRTNVDRIAEMLGMSRRSLQRRLAESKTSFSNLLTLARFAAARRMLRDRAVKVIDVSFELGYTDPAHFTNAFRQWTGVSPRAYRSHPVVTGRAA